MHVKGIFVMILWVFGGRLTKGGGTVVCKGNFAMKIFCLGHL